ncbi:MAG: sigma-54-dependent Fis family transcriptional regulator [Acidobacteria bacterium]|nr:sigma-54-dependent Fis family transcriptional regulator [Acidobacteriota bacterium]MBK8150772.1 sigma-54-dependent Fis family transcriptional regulator [Acidobacteriota bacterium]MBK8812232.1 sigma-54-dependent Fis family transcriptional regulator [Acidobacteriota bacterium]
MSGNMARKSILVVDDEKSQREILEMILSGEGYDVTTASSGEAAMKFVADRHFDLVLTDLQMGGMTGLELLKQLTDFDKSIIVLLLTAHGTVDSAVDALRLGAFDYLQKPYDREKLLDTISRALNKLTNLDAEIVSISPEMDRVKKMILKVAKSNSTVLIRGESGTGKELIARSIHNNSLRSNQIFQAVNCAAINENLLESELFGHEKGSFTGAIGEKKGLFEVADNGTLFLDEIGELDISLQAKILRALQEKQIRRVGGTREINVDVRVVAATNRDLLKMTQEGSFREDLYYRLNVLSIEIPPLRERRTDINLLMEFFIKKHTRSTNRQIRISPDAKRIFDDYHYPGNVRQLESAVERAILLCENDTITLDDMPPEMTQGMRPANGDSGSNERFKLPPEGVNFEDVERSLIMQAMERTDNNITKSAKLLGLTFRTLQYRLEKFGFKRDGMEEEGE